MLENELVMIRFIEDVVKDKYTDDELLRLNTLLTQMYDNDMFDILMGQKCAADFIGRYDQKIAKDIEDYAKTRREKGNSI